MKLPQLPPPHTHTYTLLLFMVLIEATENKHSELWVRELLECLLSELVLGRCKNKKSV